jgi:hypothetical protein
VSAGSTVAEIQLLHHQFTDVVSGQTVEQPADLVGHVIANLCLQRAVCPIGFERDTAVLQVSRAERNSYSRAAKL